MAADFIARVTFARPCALLKIVFVGLFFNQLLPTGVGGDAVRAWRCSKLGIGLGTAIRSILLDRAWGYTVLLGLYIAILPGLLHVLPQTRERVSVVALLVVALAALLGLVSLDYLPRPLLRLRVIAPFAELSREGRRLLMHPGRCAAVLGFSVLTIALALVVYKLSSAMGSAAGFRLASGPWSCRQ